MKRFLGLIWRGSKLAFYLTLISSITPVYCFSETKFDGYFWEEMDKFQMPPELVKATKILFIRGFVGGVQIGNVQGNLNGFYSGAKYTYDEFEEILLKQYKIALKEPKEFTSFLQKRKAIVWLKMQDEIKKSDLNESNEYYLRELDSFLKTYPMCKRKGLFLLLNEIVMVWQKQGTKTYKDIGEECLTSKE